MRPAYLLALATAALTGCASTVFDGGREWKDGWREGRVEKVAAGTALGFRHTFDCRYRSGEGRRATGLFAVIGVEHMGRHRHHVVPVRQDGASKSGDQVLTNVRRCDSPIARSGR